MSMIFMIFIVTTMISLMVIILSLRRKLNWKPYVVIGTRESFFGWRPKGTAGKFLLGAKFVTNVIGRDRPSPSTTLTPLS